MIITNEKGRRFLVRVVSRGDKYGRDDCLTHDEADPLIEFYDLAHARGEGIAARGMFVSRYYARTLAGDHVDLRRRGLCLDGGVPEWGVDAAALGPVLDIAVQVHVPRTRL